MENIKKLLQVIDEAVNRLSNHASAQQEPIFKKLLGMVKALETRQDVLLNNLKNLKLIANIKLELERLMINNDYKSEVKAFVQSYNDIQKLQNAYFSKFSEKFTSEEKYRVLKKTAIEATLNGLTEIGLSTAVTDEVKKILFDNTKIGGSYSDMTEQLRAFMLPNNDNGEVGALERHVRTYSTTAINQFNRELGKSISDDLNLSWFMYDGSLLTTSRPFCIECVSKKYIHISEFGELLKGHINDKQITISKSTGLPNGMMAGTDKNNLVRRAGGYNCAHTFIAVDDTIVPQNVKDTVYATGAYKRWKK